MVLIIIHHYFYHSNINPKSYLLFDNNTIFMQFMSSFGKFGSTLYILISSYFLIDSKIKYKKLIPLFVKLLFFSLLMLSLVMVFTQEKILITDLFKSFLPVLWGNWFIINYIILFLFLPYINSMLKNLDQTLYKNLVITLLIVWSFIPTISNYAWNFSGIDYFLCVYIIGAYIKLHYIDNYSKTHYLKMLLISVSLILVSIIITVYLSIYFKSDKLFNFYQSYYQLNSFLPLISSIFLFLYFKNIELQSNIINYISASSLSIYLIHDNFLFRNVLWNSFFPNLDYVNTNLFIPHFILKVLFVFFICVFVDKVFAYTLEKPLNNMANNIVNKIEKVIQNNKLLKHKSNN